PPEPVALVCGMKPPTPPVIVVVLAPPWPSPPLPPLPDVAPPFWNCALLAEHAQSTPTATKESPRMGRWYHMRRTCILRDTAPERCTILSASCSSAGCTPRGFTPAGFFFLVMNPMSSCTFIAPSCLSTPRIFLS